MRNQKTAFNGIEGCSFFLPESSSGELFLYLLGGGVAQHGSRDLHVDLRLTVAKAKPGLRIRIRIGFGFNWVSGSGFGIRIRIQEGKNDFKK
jgi:hypothetical protein